MKASRMFDKGDPRRKDKVASPTRAQRYTETQDLRIQEVLDQEGVPRTMINREIKKSKPIRRKSDG